MERSLQVNRKRCWWLWPLSSKKCPTSGVDIVCVVSTTLCLWSSFILGDGGHLNGYASSSSLVFIFLILSSIVWLTCADRTSECMMVATALPCSLNLVHFLSAALFVSTVLSPLFNVHSCLSSSDSDIQDHHSHTCSF